MKIFTVSAVSMWLVLAGGFACAAESPVPSERADGGIWVADTNLLHDFATRLNAAMASRDLGAIQALYQTNGVSIVELKIELDRWLQMFAENSGARLNSYFKVLDKLPPQARAIWTTRAHQMITRQVSHLAGISAPNQGRVLLELPLAVCDGKLWIEPSDRRNRSPAAR